jgi:hypothetical protein
MRGARAGARTIARARARRRRANEGSRAPHAPRQARAHRTRGARAPAPSPARTHLQADDHRRCEVAALGALAVRELQRGRAAVERRVGLDVAPQRRQAPQHGGRVDRDLRHRGRRAGERGCDVKRKPKM